MGPDTTTSPPANPFSAVIPTTPGSIAFLPASGASSTATNLNNSSSATALQFAVSGVTAGDEVEILCDGNVINDVTQAIVPTGATSINVTTNGTTALSDGPHTFTAIQIAPSQTVSVTETGSSTPVSDTANVPSFNSAGVQLAVETTPPQFNFPQAVTAVAGVPYSCQVSVSAGSSTGIVYALTGTPPTGMAIDATTGMITWTPTASQVGTAQVNVQATDAASNTASQQYSINVLASNAAPVLTAATPSLGTTDSTIAVTIPFTAFINGASGTTTQITDSDTNAVLGGIAIVGTTGNGTWSYILNGTTTPVAIGSVSTSSALLLPHDASLYYTPNGTPETATITYHAWDTTGGAATGRADLSQASDVGGSTAYSTVSDTASLTVVNTCSISGFVYLNIGGQARAAIQGVAITLSDSGSGVWTTMTGADGSYHFNGLAAGTYQIVEAQPACYIDGTSTLGTVGGSPVGAHTQNQFTSVVIPVNNDATGYNFSEIGVKVQYIASWMFMDSAPTTVAAVLCKMDAAPSVDLAAPAAGSGFSTTYQAGSPTAVNIAAAGATITDSDSSYFASMTATITNLRDGAAEKLAATTTGTQITAAYSGGVLTLSGVDTKSNYETVLRSIVYSDTGSTDGDRTINVVVSDGMATSQIATAVVSVGPDTTAPSGYSIIAKDAEINATKATATGFTFAGAEIGATYTYSITSSASTTAAPLTGSGTITSATQVIGNIDVSSLLDGTLTYDVYLTDEAGNVGNHVTATAVLDRVPPAAFTVTPTNSTVNSSNNTSTGFTITGGEEFTSYSYTISSSGSTTATPVTGSGTLSLTTQTFGGIAVSSLPDGTLTFSVTLTDAAGNSTTETGTATLDTVAPSGYSISANDAEINAAKATTTGFTFAGAEVARRILIRSPAAAAPPPR